MSYFLRRATFMDADAISTLIAGVWDRIFTSPDRAGAQVFLASVTPPSIAGFISAANFHYLVIEEEGEIVAAGALRDGRHVYHLWVKASHQGRGLARKLWRALEAGARANGNLGEFTVNASIDAIPVYTAFGFRPEGERQENGGLAFQPMAIRLP
jgi:ribosomal protein S18 acetylase RimI-like enzyme